jgi:type I restriction enzyme M protein
VIASLDNKVPDTEVDEGGSPSPLSFGLRADKVLNNIFVPRYYNPHIEERLQVLSDTYDLVSIAALSKQGVLSLDTGIEVGKMAYGTGPIPFIRTSDITNWELKSDPKQSVSEELYDQFKDQLDVRAEDLFIVRDGTYLVGTSCILTEHDTRILYCGGLYKIRVNKKDQLDPYLLLALLNCPIAKRQMRAKQFTRDVIDTLGKRICEVILPVPKDKVLRDRIARETRETVLERVALRNKAKQIVLSIEGLEEPGEEDKELLENI